MVPKYFPFSFITEAILSDIHVFFPKMILYQPLSKDIPEAIKQNKPVVDVRVPFIEHAEIIQNICEAFHRYGDLLTHQGEAFHRFFSVQDKHEHGLSDIVNEIRCGQPSIKTEELDPAIQAGVFMNLSQELDRQTCEIDSTFHLISQKQGLLFEALTGENAQLNNHRIMDEPSFPHQVHGMDQRISAWIFGYLHDTKNDQSLYDIWVTPSQQVVDYLQETYHLVELTDFYSQKQNKDENLSIHQQTESYLQTLIQEYTTNTTADDQLSKHTMACSNDIGLKCFLLKLDHTLCKSYFFQHANLGQAHIVDQQFYILCQILHYDRSVC
ncbi:MAG: hypothetical protein HQK77_16135 [Desulfobacterales bacterium]|nr:hypothetical protein [Desulfobacterales bacterium]